MTRKGPRPEVKKRNEIIEKKVREYVKSCEVKDEAGKVIDNPALVVAPETLQRFYISGVLSGLNREEQYYAKCYYKDVCMKDAFKEYRESRGRDKDLRIADIIHFKELQERGGI